MGTNVRKTMSYVTEEKILENIFSVFWEYLEINAETKKRKE